MAHSLRQHARGSDARRTADCDGAGWAVACVISLRTKCYRSLAKPVRIRRILVLLPVYSPRRACGSLAASACWGPRMNLPSRLPRMRWVKSLCRTRATE